MSTATTLAVLREIRNRLLTFAPMGGGATLKVLIGSTTSGSGSDGKLFLNQAPDNISGFWGILRLIDFPQTGFDGGFLIRGQAELILYGRPRKVQSDVERMADLVTEAWLHWATNASGHISATAIQSRFAIPYEEPADRELVAVRLVLPFRCIPSFLLQYAAP
jgi:hypothetical protein